MFAIDHDDSLESRNGLFQPLQPNCFPTGDGFTVLYIGLIIDKPIGIKANSMIFSLPANECSPFERDVLNIFSLTGIQPQEQVGRELVWFQFSCRNMIVTWWESVAFSNSKPNPILADSSIRNPLTRKVVIPWSLRFKTCSLGNRSNRLVYVVDRKVSIVPVVMVIRVRISNPDFISISLLQVNIFK